MGKKIEQYEKTLMQFLIGALVLFGLYLTSLYSYLLFHSLAEVFSVAVAFAIFMLVWNARRFIGNSSLLLLGIGYLFIGGLDFIHTLAYKGMGVFRGYDTNLPTQLWIAARYIESLVFLAVPLFLQRRLKPGFLFFGFTIITVFLLASIFYWGIFPVCFVEGVGLTSFKKISEYIISLIFLAAIVLLVREHEEFDPGVFRLLIGAIIVRIASELAFTFYISAYGFANLIGHFLKIVSFYLIYKALIEIGLRKPYNLLFRDLEQAKETAEAASRAKSALLANMSHELRTPLNSILGFSQILEMEAESMSEEHLGFIRHIKGSGEHLLEMVNDILDLSKIEAGRIEIEKMPFHLNEMLLRLRATIAYLANKKKIRVEANIGPDLGLIEADEVRIKQVLYNLLSNAI